MTDLLGSLKRCDIGTLFLITQVLPKKCSLNKIVSISSTSYFNSIIVVQCKLVICVIIRFTRVTGTFHYILCNYLTLEHFSSSPARSFFSIFSVPCNSTNPFIIQPMSAVQLQKLQSFSTNIPSGPWIWFSLY